MRLLPIRAFFVAALAIASAPALALTAVQTEMRPLPGALNKVEVLNSNSPEVVQTPGVLVSTLNHSFNGRFDIFFHHISKKDPVEANSPPLYIGVVLHNPGTAPVTVEVLAGASYLSQPDAPFIPLAASTDNPDGDVYAGPGDRVANDILRGKLQDGIVTAKKLEVPAGGDVVLSSLPIPVAGLTPPLNGRSYLVKLRSSGPVQAATLGLFSASCPADSDWFTLLKTGFLAGPRETPATPPSSAPTPFAYGRVAGISAGDTWTAHPNSLPIAPRGQSISFPISSVERGTFGTGQIQSAPLLAREPETAYAAHGNYGIKYDITLPLENRNKQSAMVLVKLQTPIKSDQKTGTLQFYGSGETIPPRVFFRGTVRTSFVDAQGQKHEKYTHLSQRQGEPSTPLVAQYLLPKEKRTVRLEFVYPPDATPPQALTIESADPDSLLD